EDGIRDLIVTGVQTCALPICPLAEERVLVARRVALACLPAEERVEGRRVAETCALAEERVLAARPVAEACCVAEERVVVTGHVRSEERRVGQEVRSGVWVCES